MAARFAKPRRGKIPLYPKTGRAAFYGCLIGIGVSSLFYPQIRADLGRPAGVEQFRAGSAKITALDEARITVKVVLKPGPEEADSEQHTIRLLRRMREIGRRVLREERAQ
jgi:hypothetical protein